jgi:hypothetical protein
LFIPYPVSIWVFSRNNEILPLVVFTSGVRLVTFSKIRYSFAIASCIEARSVDGVSLPYPAGHILYGFQSDENL